VVATANGSDDDKKVGSSDMECVMIATHNGKSHLRPLIDHFERLLEEACSNHAYPVKDKLKYIIMIKNFMTSGSLTQDKEPEEEQGGSDVMPFPGEDTVVYARIRLPRGDKPG
jgi:hypothetical protein